VSGGPDSMALLAVSADVLGPSAVDAVYLDHGLRDRASIDAEIALIDHYCKGRGIRFSVRKLPVRAESLRTKDGIEAAGREWRYRVLTHLAKVRGYSTIMTAHHRSDAAETVLLKIMRGSGMGLSGIRRSRNDRGIQILRPFMDLTKSQLLAYCRSHSIPYLVDVSNDDIRFSRNRIRKEIIPQMAAINSDIEAELVRFADRVEEMTDYIRSHIQPHWIRLEQSDYYLSEEVADAHPTLQRAVTMALLARLTVTPSADRINRVIDVFVQPIGTKIQLSKQWYMIRATTGLRFTPVSMI